jgi:hypothetical protein
MGIGPFKISKSTFDTPRYAGSSPQRVEVVVRHEHENIRNPNPNPKRYTIKRSRRFGKASGLGNYLVIEINYPDCTNYEGNKILVFEDTTLIELSRQGGIDPHFSNNLKYKSPIGRFVPTKEGLTNAKMFAMMLGSQA